MWSWRALALTSSMRNVRSTLQSTSTTPIAREIHRWVAPTLKELYKRKRLPSTYVKPKKFYPRSGFLEWNPEAELYAFGSRLGEDFDPNLLQRAFTHRSYVIQQEMKQKAVGIENPDLQFKDNREFIEQGEAFMRDYIQAYLLAALPKFPQAGVEAVRDYLTTNKMLAHISENLGTKDLILCDEYPPTEKILADTFKAIVAALAHSNGERAGHFVRDFIVTMLHGEDVNEIWVVDNPMEMLKEILAKSGKEPEPRLIGHLGKNSLLSCYRVGIYVDKEMLCYGFGETVKIAVEMAAREGLKVFFGTQENMPPINFKLSGHPTAQIEAAEKSSAV